MNWIVETLKGRDGTSRAIYVVVHNKRVVVVDFCPLSYRNTLFLCPFGFFSASSSVLWLRCSTSEGQPRQSCETSMNEEINYAEIK